MKKRLALAAVVLALTVCTSALFVHPAKDSKVTIDSYDRIRVGMTRQKVEDILGSRAQLNVAWPDHWFGQDVSFCVNFDAQGRVSSKYLTIDHDIYELNKKPSLWDEVRSWLPW
jgi:hypothetical protein